MTNEEWNTYFNGHWYFNGAKQDKHLAMFPEELPKRLIKMFSFPQETVLDPFMGSGTTATVANTLGRNSIGYEINPDFIPLIQERIKGDLYSAPIIKLVKQEGAINFKEEMQQLPYQFVDTHKIDKKIDVKQLQFGSKIDVDSPSNRQELFTVTKVVSPELLQLSNGLFVRLIGIREKEESKDEAIAFLLTKCKGKKVFLKYDQQKYDANNHLLVYLYLENKTFINAHLLKQKLAFVEENMEYKNKQKFLNL